jgi:L-arabinose isomerase
MDDLKQFEVWFVTGSQDLYGPETLRQVDQDSQTIAKSLDANAGMPVRVVFKPVVTTPEAIYQLCLEANSTPNCIGLITWMHTFSPARMWIAGLTVLRKPFVHLHTQFNRDIPWDSIDMDFMNLNQSAHGDREFGFIGSRLRIARKVVVGHWQEAGVVAQLGTWARAAAAWHDAQGARIARFGDNMREVAVTEGDKVEAQIRFGYAVNGYSVGDLAAFVQAVPAGEVNKLLAEYDETYAVAPELRAAGARRASLADAARLELGRRLQGVHHQLPGLARVGAITGVGLPAVDGVGLWFRC